jgi:SM-20-related protein
MNDKFSTIVDQLVEKGWVAIPEFLPASIARDILDEQVNLIEEGEFRKAGIGRGATFQVKPEIRGDHVLWLEADNLSSNVGKYWQAIEELRKVINRECFLNLNSFEAHFAMYPAGTFYKRHIDQFQNVKYRIITCILYLNPDWQPEHEGKLRVYFEEAGEEKHIDIEPRFGTFVCFRSADIPHEVLPTKKERFSITGWLRY